MFEGQVRLASVGMVRGGEGYDPGILQRKGLDAARGYTASS
jgi:hypothetical protein